MPLSAQEQRCIDHACDFLNGARGGDWKVEDGPTLDDQYPNAASPEVIVTNGTETAAIEVKEVTGDPVWDSYRWSRDSLLTSLVPSCGGTYFVNPFIDLRLPMEPKLVRRVKREIERVAPTLVAPGDRGAIRIPRFAHVIQMNNVQTPSRIDCYHSSAEVLRISSELGVPGWYTLADGDSWEHQIVTDEGRADFLKAMHDACALRASGSVSVAHWYEEWEIVRLENNDEPDFVEIMACTEARDLFGAAIAAVGARLMAGQEKFAHTRWADLHVLVLENTDRFVLTSRHLSEAAATFTSSSVQHIDLVLLLEADRLQRVWPV